LPFHRRSGHDHRLIPVTDWKLRGYVKLHRHVRRLRALL
jgi:hypothetical protein